MDKGMTERRLSRLRSVAARRQMDVAVVLENVHDMHNVGAVLRTCDATGVQSVYILVNDPGQEIKNLALGKRTSSGARKWVDVYAYRNTDRCLLDLKTRYERIVATGIGEGTTGNTLYSIDFSKPTALVFGNEHSGLSDKMQGAADQLFTIPQLGMTQSLNISVACAVSLYEMYRQRQEKGMIPRGDAIGDGNRRDLFDTFKQRQYERYTGKQLYWPEEE